MTLWIFWLSAAAVAYAYVGYPLLLGIVGSLRRRRVRKELVTPRVSLIIAAYNEEQNIGRRLDNALSLDYPSRNLEIIVASDGSDDSTEAMVKTYAPRGVRLLSLARRGKIHALDAAISSAGGEILAFSDANVMYDSQALRRLARNFADPEVGGAAGAKVYRIEPQSDSSSRGEDLYWSYDTWIKGMESLTGSIVSADGAIYAIRANLYRRPADTAVTDDFAISTGVIEQGYRLVFDGEARAYEAAMPAAEREFGRKVRLITRGLRGVILRRRLLNPFRYGFYSIALFSHKLLRRLVPLWLLMLFFGSALTSASGRIYWAAAVAQSSFYAIACLGYLLRRTRLGGWKCFYVPFFYCLANAAALVAMVRLLRGDHIELWRPQRHGTGT